MKQQPTSDSQAGPTARTGCATIRSACSAARSLTIVHGAANTSEHPDSEQTPPLTRQESSK